MLPAFLAFLFAVVIVLACLKGKIWVAALLSLLFIGGVCKTIAAILAYALPNPAIIMGANMPMLPIGIGFLMLALAFLNIAFRNKQNEPPTEEQTFVRWILLGGGIAVPLMGYVYFSVAIYSPELLASTDPNPSLGVMVFIPVVLLGVILKKCQSKIAIRRPEEC